MAIDSQHPAFTAAVSDWRMIGDICEGKDFARYIEAINPEDTSNANKQRNDSFRRRAVFYEIAGYTARGMVGLLFKKEPTLEVPDGLEYLKDNCDGAGVGTYQQAQETTMACVRYGRAGLWVDFPRNDNPLSMADLRQRQVMATIERFEPHQIINWATRTVGALNKLALVVIQDTELELQPDYSQQAVRVILELFLDEAGVYTIRKWRAAELGGWQVVEEVIPRDAAGMAFNEIPFTFVGSSANTPAIDNAPMLPIVRINIGHLNNSASYEDSCFIAGQPQPWMSGLSLELAHRLRDEGFYWGAGTLLPVPDGGQVGMIQAQPNIMVREAMRDKVEMAIGLGALFIQPGSAVKTATQSAGEQQVSHSVLSLIGKNVSEAYELCLLWLSRFMGLDVTEEDCEFNLATDFVEPQASAQDLQAVVAGMLQGALPFSDFWAWAQKHGFADANKSPEDAREEMDQARITVPNLGGMIQPAQPEIA